MGSKSGDDNADGADRGFGREEDLMDTSWLDDAFVNAAPVTEKSAEERIEERRADEERRRMLDEFDAQDHLAALSHRARRRRFGVRVVSAVLVVGMTLSGLYWGSHARRAVSDVPTPPLGADALPTTAATLANLGASYANRTYRRVAADGSTRNLRTEVWMPDGKGPFPIVVFAHGNDGNPRKFHQLFEAWATAGFAVVAPRFPVSADDADGDLEQSVKDVPEQDRDLEFVLRETLRSDAAEARSASRQQRLDPDEVAVAGLSLGGGTALQASYGGCCPGLRPKLVMAFSPLPFETEHGAGAAPLLIIHGTDDQLIPIESSRSYFDAAQNRRWLVTLDGAGHGDPYEDAPSSHDALVRSVTIDFLEQFLAGDERGVARARQAITASGTASIDAAG